VHLKMKMSVRAGESEAEKASFVAAKARVPEQRVHNDTVVDLLGVAEEMLKSALEYRLERVSEDGKLSRACQHPDNLWSLHGLHECLTRRRSRRR
jgi:hypothetical protein